MFLDFYQMKEQPFGVTPDPRFLYLGKSHREALASLYYGVESNRGFVALDCTAGTWKDHADVSTSSKTSTKLPEPCSCFRRSAARKNSFNIC